MNIPLKDAVFCANCETITPRATDCRCECCGSDGVIDLDRVLNGIPQRIWPERKEVDNGNVC